MNTSWLFPRLGLTYTLLLMLLPFVINEAMPQVYPEEDFEYEAYELTRRGGFWPGEGEWIKKEVKARHTQLWSLKFMPPCTPFGGDTTCGLDALLIAYWFILGLLAMLFSWHIIPTRANEHVVGFEGEERP